MDKKQLDETFGGIVNNEFDAVVGKMVQKDGKYVFEGVSLNKKGQVVGSITYVAGICTLIYLGAKAGYKIGETIANKINQRRINKTKAEAFDDLYEIVQKGWKREEMLEKALEKEEHSKDKESE